MKHFHRAAAMALVLAAISPAPAMASGSLSGTYVTTVHTAGTLDGTYHITFSPGHFVLHAPYGLIGHGTYSISGSRITLHGPGSCGSAGVYEYRASGSSLSFRKIRDVCSRVGVLTAHPLRKV